MRKGLDMSSQPVTLAARCTGLWKRYEDVVAVAGIDLEVRLGECFGLLGPNGAGKTTTVEMLEGLTAPDGGDIEVLGERWHATDNHRAARAARRPAPGDPAPRQAHGGGGGAPVRELLPRPRPVDEVIALVELEEKRRARVGKLSGGQRQRLALACALVSNPDLLFLDEPTTGLDPQARLKVWELVEGFKSGGGTVLLTTHYMEEAARLCDRVAILDHGKVIALGSPAELVASLHAEQIVEVELAGAGGPDRAGRPAGRERRGRPGRHGAALGAGHRGGPAGTAGCPGAGRGGSAPAHHPPGDAGGRLRAPHREGLA